MSEWIECNLPWEADIEVRLPTFPEYPNMDKKVKKHFGYTEKEMEKSLFPGCKYANDHPFFKQDQKIREKLENKYPNDWRDRLAKSRNPAVKAVNEWIKCRKEIEEWVSIQPEVIEWHKEYERVRVANIEKQNTASFCGARLNKPGTLIERKDGDEIAYEVIGHINKNGGVCDDCMGISKDTMILRYKMLWDQLPTTKVVDPQITE
jgi:hypothetical protein